eukprot:2078957-Pyramimonas_sp.AAC.1
MGMPDGVGRLLQICACIDARVWYDCGRQGARSCSVVVPFYDILYSESQFHSDSVKAELPQLGQMLAQLYSDLAREAWAANIRMWKMSPKLHLWEHLTEEQ